MHTQTRQPFSVLPGRQHCGEGPLCAAAAVEGDELLHALLAVGEDQQSEQLDYLLEF